MAITIDKETAKTIVDLLLCGFNAEEDVFGVLHNIAVDIVGMLEIFIEEEKTDEMV